jgi:hypothetical protein
VLGPFEGAIDKLVGHHHFAGMDIFSEAPGSAHRNQVLRAETLHAEDVGAEIYLAGKNAMAFAVPRQKDDLGIADMSANKRIRRFAKGGIDFDLLDAVHARHLVEAAPADHSDCRLGHLLYSSHPLRRSLTAGRIQTMLCV